MKSFLRRPAPLSTSVWPLTVVWSSRLTPATVIASAGMAIASDSSVAASFGRMFVEPPLGELYRIGDGSQGTGHRWCSREDNHLSPVPCALSPKPKPDRKR